MIGKPREPEVEHIGESGSRAVPRTCAAMEVGRIGGAAIEHELPPIRRGYWSPSTATRARDASPFTRRSASSVSFDATRRRVRRGRRPLRRLSTSSAFFINASEPARFGSLQTRSHFRPFTLPSANPFPGSSSKSPLLGLNAQWVQRKPDNTAIAPNKTRENRSTPKQQSSRFLCRRSSSPRPAVAEVVVALVRQRSRRRPRSARSSFRICIAAARPRYRRNVVQRATLHLLALRYQGSSDSRRRRCHWLSRPTKRVT